MMLVSGVRRRKSYSIAEEFMNVSLNVMRRLVCAARSQARFVAAALFSFGLVAGAVSGARAEGFAITEWSARGMALGGGAGGGMVARADDPSAVAYNPAGITQIPGTAVQMGMAVSALNFDITRDDNRKTVSSSNQVWPIPHFYLTHQINDNWWVGIGTFTRYGLGSQFPDNWTARSVNTSNTLPYLSSGIKSVTLLSSTINPTLAYKINDVWSVSAGVSYTWGYLSLNEQYNQGHPLYPGMTLGSADARIHSENGYAFGYNFGIHARFNDQWSAGLTYRASEDMTFKGSTRFRFSGQQAVVDQMKLHMQNCNADGKLTIPDVITLGVMYKPLSNLSFEGDVAYTVWSRYRNLTINMDSHGTTPTFFEQKNWRDTWAFTFGVEYEPLDWLTLRAGFTYETSPLQDENCYDYLVPSNGRNYYTLGAGFKYENWTLDLAYMYIDVRGINYKDRAGKQGPVDMSNTHKGRSNNSYAHNVGLTIGYKF